MLNQLYSGYKSQRSWLCQLRTRSSTAFASFAWNFWSALLTRDGHSEDFIANEDLPVNIVELDNFGQLRSASLAGACSPDRQLPAKRKYDMNFFELDVSYFRSNESFFVGLFHGSLFSVPLSIPSLFLVSTTHQRSSKSAFLNSRALLATFSALLMSVFVFFGLICHCPRPLLQFWMSTEPGFMLLGLVLLSRARTPRLWSELVEPTASGRILLFLLPHIPAFLATFFLFFNPVFPALLSKILVSQELLEHFTLVYALGFVSSAGCAFFMQRILGPHILKGIENFVYFCTFVVPRITRLNLFNTNRLTAAQTFGTGENQSVELRDSRLNQDFTNSTTWTKLSSFCFLGLFIHGFLHSSWRIFLQYPFEFFTFPRSGEKASATSERQNNQNIFLREFPSFDSSIRHREKNLPVDRHLPIERMQSRRTLSGRPAFNEEQKSDAALKYNSFFLNAFEHLCLDAQLSCREGQILRIAPSTADKAENSAKGKPKFSYIGNRLSGNASFVAQDNKTMSKMPALLIRTSFDEQNPGLSYLHDDLSVLHLVSTV